MFDGNSHNTMCMRKRLLFYTGYWCRNWRMLLSAPLMRYVDSITHDPSSESVRIVGARTGPEDRPKFVARTVEALAMLKARDPRRFQRLKREIHRISDMAVPWSTASYNRPLRECKVNFGRFNFEEDPELALQYYCCVLVHEATHGACYSRWINYTVAFRTRIERLCCLEAERFARRAFPDIYEYLIREFDPSRWEFSWRGSRWKKWALSWPVIKEVFRNRNVKSTVENAQGNSPPDGDQA
jgi:hypothetical protein